MNMTWVATEQEGRVQGDARNKLLAKRVSLLKELEDMGLRPVSKTEAGKRFDQVDRLKLAAKIISIDKKLGGRGV